MLPKSCRLNRQQFWQVQKAGFGVQGLEISVKYLVNDVGYPRFSVVTSAKLDKRAVVRNRLRRKIYSQLSTLNSQLSIDAIIFPRPSMLNLDNAKLNVALNQVVSKISGLV